MKKITSTLILVFVFLFQIQTPQTFAADPLTPSIQSTQREVPVLFNEPVAAPSVSQQSAGESFMQASALSAASAPSEPRVAGLQPGQTVSGIIEVSPNQQQLPGIKKVAYYLDGNRSGKVYQAPFMWGGSTGDGTTGFDTRTTSDGAHTLAMVYTDSSGDHTISIDFTINNSSVPPEEPGDANQAIWGVDRFETVGGVLRISPNPNQLPAGTSEVTWTLVGQHSVTVTEEPYVWGGTNGFDTRTLPDGVYDLILQAQGTNGSLSSTTTFVVENKTDPVPAPTVISPSDRTAGGFQFSTATSFVDIEQIGNLSILADQKALYIVDASSANQPRLLSAVDFNFNPPILDILSVPAGNAVFVLEQGAYDPVNGSPEHPVYKSRLWRVDLTNPSSPVRKLVATNILSGRSLQIQGNTLYVVYAGDQDALYPCPTDGSACGIPTDLYALRDQIYITSGERFSAVRGSATIRNTGNNINGDFIDTVASAPIANLIGKDNLIFVSLKNGTTAVYNLTQKNTATGALILVKTIDPQGNDPISSVVEGNRLAILDSTGLIEIFDISNIQSPTRIDSFTIAGAKRLTLKNGAFYVVTNNQYRVIGSATAPPTAGDSRILGLQEGQVVKGTIQVRPNQTQLPGIKKVAYYVNGNRSGKVYQSPFLWGGVAGDGTTGFDTRTLANGTYTLSMVYTDSTGDHTISVSFKIQNT